MNSSISISGLTKKYKGTKTPALSNLSLNVNAGKCYGFLGANGAGKSTAIRLLLNFIQPTSGNALILGKDVTKDVSYRGKVGYLAGDIALYQKSTGSQLLDYLCRLSGVTDKTYRKTLEERFHPDLNKPISSLSKGNRQKIGLIQAFMHQPDVLILDEPTSGLDPLMQEELYKTIKENTDRGAAVFMSSHNLTEAQRICDRVGIIKQGKMVHEQEIGEDSTLAKPIFQLELIKPAPAKLLSSQTFKVIQKINSKTLLIQPKDDIAKTLAELSKYEIKDFYSKKADLEDEFLEFYGDTQ